MKLQLIPASRSCHPHHSLNLVLWLHHSVLFWAIIIHPLPDQNYGQQRLCPNSISNSNVHRARKRSGSRFSLRNFNRFKPCLAMASLVFYVVFNRSLFFLNPLFKINIQFELRNNSMKHVRIRKKCPFICETNCSPWSINNAPRISQWVMARQSRWQCSRPLSGKQGLGSCYCYNCQWVNWFLPFQRFSPGQSVPTGGNLHPSGLLAMFGTFWIFIALWAELLNNTQERP